MGLARCLSALRFQTFPADLFEVIVVDDGSVPPLQDVAEADRAGLPVQYIRANKSGPAAARNRGARAARGRYLAFTDHDCEPEAGWLTALFDGVSAHPDSQLGGPKRNGLPGNDFATAHQIVANFAEDWFRAAGGATGYFTTNNLAVPRERFWEIGGFDASFPFANEDREFGARWDDRGYGRAWIPGAGVVHRHEMTLGKFLRQQFRYGAGAVDFRRARGRVEGGKRVRFEGLRFHAGLVAAPFREHGVVRGVWLAALLAAAQLAYVMGVLYRAQGQGRAQ